MEMTVLNDQDVPIQPNLNAKVYRDSIVADHMLRAPNIEFLKIHLDNTTLIGSSDLTGRYWNGAATVSKSPEDAITAYKDKHRTQLHLDSGVTDGCFLDSNKIVLSEDSGSLSVWSCGSVDSTWLKGIWTKEQSVNEHEDAILSIDILQQPDVVVTGVADGCIKVWNLVDMVPTVCYNDAHDRAVNQVAAKPESTSIFVSCGYDKNICLWDTNSPTKRKTVATLRCGACCVCWYSEHELLCGSDAGDLVLVDIRGGRGNTDYGIVKYFAEFPKSLHRIVKNSQNNLLAVACDSNIVYVTEIVKDCLKVVYENSSHKDYVRAISFDLQQSNVLYSGSWDGSIIRHEIDKTSL